MYETKITIKLIFSISLLFYSTMTNANQAIDKTEATETNVTIKKTLDKIPKSDMPSDKISSMSPDGVAREITEKLILQFYKNSTQFRNNETLMFEQVEQILYDAIAFKEVTKSVMGKHAAKASETQINKFTTILKTSLIQFYSKIFLEFEAEKFVIQKIDSVSKKTIAQYTAGHSRLIYVELIISKGSEKYPIKYSMLKSDNAWKLKNIIFNGINIGIQLRNQFSDFFNRSQNIDSAIELWSKRMTNSKNS